MKLHVGCVYWPEMTNVNKINTQTEINKENRQVLIVGAGISGAITSYRLSKKGYKVTLIDKEEVGAGSSSANTGLIQYMSDNGLKEFIDQIGKDKAERFYDQSKEAIETLIQIDKELEADINESTFTVAESLIIATDKDKVKDLKKEVKAQKENGYEVEYLDEKQLEELNIKAFGGLLGKPDINLNPYGFVYRLVEEAINKYDLSVIEGAEFVSLDELAKKPLVTLNIGGKEVVEEFDKVVFTTGYNPPDFLRVYLKNLKLVKTYVAVSQKDQRFAGEDKYLVWELEDPYTYFKKTFDERLMIGGFDEEVDHLYQYDSHKMDEDLIKKAQTMLAKDTSLQPDFSYAALFGESKDNIPYMGPSPDNNDIFVICGIGGNGTVYSTIGSEMVLKWIEGKSLEDYDTFRLGR